MTSGHTLPRAVHFFVKIASFELLLYISLSLRQIFMKLHIFAKFSVVNLRMDPVFHFT